MEAEKRRLQEAGRRELHWRRWGPYLSEREWGTVREDYSENGTAWEFFPFEHSHLRAYRWGEDGIAGICDNHQRLCFALAFWNGRDPILKERLFGLTGNQGNHGEDVKEYYYYLDSTPTHSYMKCLYKYPQAEFPYKRLLEANASRSRQEPEYELLDTGILDDNRYFDIFAEYAKVDANDILIRISVANRGPEAATLHLLPTLWFRNTWTWDPKEQKPVLRRVSQEGEDGGIDAEQKDLGVYRLALDGNPPLLFTENETNAEALWGLRKRAPVREGFLSPAHRQRQRGSGESGANRNQGVRLVHAATRSRTDYDPASAPDAHDRCIAAGPVRRTGFRRAVRGTDRRGGRILLVLSEDALRRRQTGPAAGLRGVVVDQAVLQFRGRDVARRGSGPAYAARGKVAGPRRAMGSLVQRRRHLDARQVGIPVVCGLGPGVPCDPAGHGGSRIRHAAIEIVSARVVSASERADPGV